MLKYYNLSFTSSLTFNQPNSSIYSCACSQALQYTSTSFHVWIIVDNCVGSFSLSLQQIKSRRIFRVVASNRGLWQIMRDESRNSIDGELRSDMTTGCFSARVISMPFSAAERIAGTCSRHGVAGALSSLGDPGHASVVFVEIPHSADSQFPSPTRTKRMHTPYCAALRRLLFRTRDRPRTWDVRDAAFDSRPVAMHYDGTP